MKTRVSLAAFGLVTSAALTAQASSGVDSPENGVEQMGRGSAWVARADDPLATHYNPAALAFQATSVHVGASLMFASRCFTRLGEDGKPVSPGQGFPGPGATGGPAATVCGNGAGPNPQGAFALRLTDKLAIGIALVAPHAAPSNTWPNTVSFTNKFGSSAEEPSPNRYLLISSSSVIVEPTLSLAYAPRPDLAFGAGFVWGIATADVVSFAEAISPAAPKGSLPSDDFVAHGDTRAEIKVKDLFIPGVVLGGLWSPSSNVDVGAFYKYLAGFDGHGDLNLQSNYFSTSGAVNTAPCMGKAAGCNVTNAVGAAHISFSLPMEARIGVRVHMPRAGTRPSWADKPGRKVRDPMSEDLFDVEADFTWAHDGADQSFDVRFPSGAQAIKVNGTPGTIPANGDIPRHWKDVIGARLGSDIVVLPSRLSLRGGGWFETAGQDAKDLNLDFDLAQKFGLSLGGTVRLGPVDVSIAYQHTFIATLDNCTGNGQVVCDGDVHALSGDGTAGFRSRQTVNDGSLVEHIDEVALGGTVRF